MCWLLLLLLLLLLSLFLLFNCSFDSSWYFMILHRLFIPRFLKSYAFDDNDWSCPKSSMLLHMARVSERSGAVSHKVEEFSCKTYSGGFYWTMSSCSVRSEFSWILELIKLKERESTVVPWLYHELRMNSQLNTSTGSASSVLSQCLVSARLVLSYGCHGYGGRKCWS